VAIEKKHLCDCTSGRGKRAGVWETVVCRLQGIPRT